MKSLKLTLDLVPSTCWYSNVRAILTKSQWDTLKTHIYIEASYECEICGGIGNKHPVECHEIWTYDDVKLIQKLSGLIALCPSCHSVKHFGLAQLNNKEEIALKHLMKINKISRKVAEKYVADSFMLWALRSGKKWKLDISYLSKYDIDISKLNVPMV